MSPDSPFGREARRAFAEREAERQRFAAERPRMKRVMAHPETEDERSVRLFRSVMASVFEVRQTGLGHVAEAVRRRNAAVGAHVPVGPFMARVERRN